jgi:FkbM family methyltransferase
MEPDLIFDIGSHNGDDTCYYLRKGFRVVAVDANPLLTGAMGRRFEAEVAQGRLEVLNLGIAAEEGIFSFWINEVQDTWSSFDRLMAGFNGTPCREVKVPCIRLATLMERYGVPFYLKIDIEGYDYLCIEQLDPSHLPGYVSAELLLHGRDEHGILGKLAAAGYRRFKLINQVTYTSSRPIFEREIALRGLRKAIRRVPALRQLIRRLPDRLRPKKQDFDVFPEKFAYPFKEGSSGPFGEDTHGRWLSAHEMTVLVRRVQRSFEKAGALSDCWYDVHATR